MTPRRKPGLPQSGIDRPTMKMVAFALSLDAKIRDPRIWHFEIVKRDPPKSTRYLGGESQILEHYSAEGRHIATSHRMVYADGRIGEHWHVKDLLISGAKLVDISKG
jgi:hypothetical protein